MDMFRAVVTNVAGRAARSRPLLMAAFAGRVPGLGHVRERGQGLAEYALILGLIAIVAIVSLAFLGGTIADLFWEPISKEFGDVLCGIIGICPT